ncbi:MAG: porin [Planctomycetota bacterium]
MESGWMDGICRRAALLVPFVAVALLVTSPGASAQSDDLEALRERLERLEEENAELHTRIRDLEAKDSGQWLTDERAREIRMLVSDVLADADERASYLQDSTMAGWSDHFFLASPDGRFKLQLEGQLQFRWIYNYLDSDFGPTGQPDKHIQGFEMTRTRLTFRGHVFNRDMTYLVRFGVGRGDNFTPATAQNFAVSDGSVVLRDAWMRFNLGNDWSVRLGQFKLPFNREELVPSSQQLAVERSLVNENMNLSRGQGVELTYARDTQKIIAMISDGAIDNLGGFGTIFGVNGPTAIPFTRATLEDVEWAITGRYELLLAGDWRQFADFTSPPGEAFGALLGLAGHAQQLEAGRQGQRTEHEFYAATVDLSLEFGGATLFGSFTYAYADGQFGLTSVYGGVMQGSAYFTPKLEGFLRFEYGWWSADFQVPSLTTFSFGTNYYIDGHDLKWSTDLSVGVSVIESFWDSELAGFRPGARGSEPQVVFRTQFQLLF